MTQILAVSKLGQNVLTATDPNNFIFHSSYNTFKILAQGTASYTIPANSLSAVEKIVAHNQSTPPFVFSFIKWPNGYAGMPLTTKHDTSALSNQVWNEAMWIDSTHMHWSFKNFDASNSIDIVIAYFICEAPAS